MRKTYVVNGLESLPSVAEQIHNDLEHNLVLLVGDLGAGKTTLIKEIIALRDCMDVGSSPSYSIINQYKLQNGGKLYHIDLYRLNTSDEAFSLGLEDIIYSENLCLVEWPQIIYNYLEEPFHVIKIEVDSDNKRVITLT